MYYYHNDHLGTPVRMTDDAGTVVWSGDYEPFGEVLADEDPDGDGIDVENNFRFPGQYYDEETGLHYNYHRYYSSEVGRFISSGQFYPWGLKDLVNEFQETISSFNILSEINSIGYKESDNSFKKSLLAIVGNIYIENPLDFNSYHYVLNNPCLDYDPDGRVANYIAGGMLGCVLGAGYNTIVSICKDPCKGNIRKNLLKHMGRGCLKGTGIGLAFAFGGAYLPYWATVAPLGVDVFNTVVTCIANAMTR